MDPTNLKQKILYLPANQQELVQKALDFATQAHEGQIRMSGEPYVNHCAAVAEILAELKVDTTTLAAGLLHDVLEDTSTSKEQLQKEFGNEVLFLVEAVSKLGHLKYRGQERAIENFRRMFLAMAKDIRVILVKLADRLHNMRTIQWLPEEKQKRIAAETIQIYAPIANRLGMGHLKGELEDLCFPVLYPKEFEWLKTEVKQRYGERTAYLEKLKPVVEQELSKENILFFEINFRAKRYWSLWRKLQRYSMDWDRIHDLVAARIIVRTIADCYAVLGVIHKLWHPLPGRIKDFIALPRTSGYQSLHTTVFANGSPESDVHGENAVVEFQIRTVEMHEIAEKGIAAHWLYDEFGKEKRKAELKRSHLSWLNQLRDWQETIKGANPAEFMDALKIDFFNDRIFVFTPKGDVIDLPEGATPVDFAYQVHSQLGNACSGAKINGKMAAISDPLKNNDVVEIITAKNKKPSRDWLTFVKTSEAKRHIQQVLGLTKPPLQRRRQIKVQFKVVVKDRIGLMKDISGLFSKYNVNIDSSSSGNDGNKKEHSLVFNVSSPPECNAEKLAGELRKVKSVLRCDKISLG